MLTDVIMEICLQVLLIYLVVNALSFLLILRYIQVNECWDDIGDIDEEEIDKDI